MTSRQSVENKSCNKVFKKIHILANKLENVQTVTHQSNGVDVKGNGKDGNGMDISVLFEEITHISL